MSKGLSAVVLAAGEGKRMKSDSPKVLLKVLMKPMIEWVTTAVAESGVDKICAVVGYESEQLVSHLEKYKKDKNYDIEYAYQTERLGTGHAVMQAVDFLTGSGSEHTLILCGDAPLISGIDISEALELHRDKNNSATIISAVVEDPYGYGRIVREGGRVVSIVEQKEASIMQREIKEINSGAYWFKTEDLLNALLKISNANSTGEYYLTDAIGILIGAGKKVGAYIGDHFSVLGANDRKGLNLLCQVARDRIIDKHLDAGVEIVVRDGIIIGPDVKIGTETVILPGTILEGNTTIGCKNTIGPNSYLKNTFVGDSSVVNASQCTDSIIGSGVRLGPFSQLRPNSLLKDNVKVGDFVEIKNSTLGEKTSIAHLTYIGDSDVGDGVNVGCGVVTVNYDGVSKARCTVGNNAFIGCNTNLIAPVKVGDGAYTAAGTTVTEDVPDGALTIGRSKQITKENWADIKMEEKRKNK